MRRGERVEKGGVEGGEEWGGGREGRSGGEGWREEGGGLIREGMKGIAGQGLCSCMQVHCPFPSHTCTRRGGLSRQQQTVSIFLY